MPVIEWRGTRAELVARLNQLVPMLAGQPGGGSDAPNPDAIQGLMLSMGIAMLGKIQEAYDIKSQGGTDALGVTWPPLSAVTLALRRKDTTIRATARAAARFARLSPERKRQIAVHHGRLLELYQSGSGAGAAARKHARSLLFRMKNVLSPSLFKRLHSELSKPLKADRAAKLAAAGATALLLRNTGRMFNSLTPSIEAPDRILRIVPGAIAVGSNVDYFKYHQSKKPRRMNADGTPRLPRRQILPDEDQSLPESWQDAVYDALQNGVRSAAFWQQFLGNQAVVA